MSKRNKKRAPESSVSFRSMLSSQNTPGQERGISCSIIKNDTTVTTDSVDGTEERRVLLQSALTSHPLEDLPDEDSIRQALGDRIRDQQEPKASSDTTAPLLLRYEDYFRSEEDRSQILPYPD